MRHTIMSLTNGSTFVGNRYRVVELHYVISFGIATHWAWLCRTAVTWHGEIATYCTWTHIRIFVLGDLITRIELVSLVLRFVATHIVWRVWLAFYASHDNASPLSNYSFVTLIDKLWKLTRLVRGSLHLVSEEHVDAFYPTLLPFVNNYNSASVFVQHSVVI